MAKMKHVLVQKLVTQYEAAHKQAKLAAWLTEDITMLELEPVNVE